MSVMATMNGRAVVLVRQKDGSEKAFESVARITAHRVRFGPSGLMFNRWTGEWVDGINVRLAIGKSRRLRAYKFDDESGWRTVEAPRKPRTATDGTDATTAQSEDVHAE